MLCALRHAAKPEVQIHAEWHAYVRTLMEAQPEYEILINAPFFWRLVPEILGVKILALNLFEFKEALPKISVEGWKKGVFDRLFQSSDLTQKLLSQSISVQDAIKHSTEKGGETLLLAELLPFQPQHPTAALLEKLQNKPASFIAAVLAFLARFQDHIFAKHWIVHEQIYADFLAQQQRLFFATTLTEFVAQNLLRIEVHEADGKLCGASGAPSLEFSNTSKVSVLCSAFNEERLWTVFQDESPEKLEACFPIFEPKLAPHVGKQGHSTRFVETQASSQKALPLDPFLVMRTLGEPSRFAVAKLLANKSMTAADLCRALGLSKATISHHLVKMRNAGLLSESVKGGHIYLSFNVWMAETLSKALVSELRK